MIESKICPNTTELIQFNSFDPIQNTFLLEAKSVQMPCSSKTLRGQSIKITFKGFYNFQQTKIDKAGRKIFSGINIDLGNMLAEYLGFKYQPIENKYWRFKIKNTNSWGGMFGEVSFFLIKVL